MLYKFRLRLTCLSKKQKTNSDKKASKAKKFRNSRVLAIPLGWSHNVTADLMIVQIHLDPDTSINQRIELVLSNFLALGKC